MKLISCHIENFGKLHNYSVDFSDGANMVCEENGWGKSTFAAFVRAMFYGLEGDRKRDIGLGRAAHLADGLFLKRREKSIRFQGYSMIKM